MEGRRFLRLATTSLTSIAVASILALSSFVSYAAPAQIGTNWNGVGGNYPFNFDYSPVTNLRTDGFCVKKGSLLGGGASCANDSACASNDCTCPVTKGNDGSCASGGTCVEPLNIMCSNMCATPRMPTCSSLDPT